jgi:mono/diheme cytochrome c family protein
MIDYLSILVLLALVILFVWLALRAWRAGNRIIRWGGTILSGLLALVFGVALVIGLFATYQSNRNYNRSNPVQEVTVAMTPEQIARGERLVNICIGCHTADFEPPLEGQDFGNEIPLPIGPFYAPNLTPIHLADWSDGEIIRTIREGVHKSGRTIVLMPVESLQSMSDDDVQALVAYLRSQEVVEPDTPPNRPTLVGAIVALVFDLFTRQEPVVGPVVAPPEGPTAEYGEYLVTIFACSGCHGEDLRGGFIPGPGGPPTPDILATVPSWTEEGFITFFRTGVLPTGNSVSENMPWQELGGFATDDDLRAVKAHLDELGQ